MKQNISVEDIQQLTDNQKEKLRELWEPDIGSIFYDGHYTQAIQRVDDNILIVEDKEKYTQNYVVPLLNIGQMIEILEKHDPCINITRRVQLVDFNKWVWEFTIRERYCREEPELCDVLWQAIKDNILKEE